MFNRLLAKPLADLKSSCFIFGPRMTGKTKLVETFSQTNHFDLLIPENELSYKKEPKKFWQEISALSAGTRIVVDEIQRVPALLDYVQLGIEKKGLSFILTGSSARKLKKGGANLLGGRAADFKLHPLTSEETGDKFSINLALQYGNLPKICTLVLLENNLDEARLLLKSYLTTYIKEEIQAEALARSVENFQRFLDIAGQANAQMIEFSNISRDSGVSASTVKEYYSILEDTLLGQFIWPLNRSERKKARPRFYFFDCGVVRAIQQRVYDVPTSAEKGHLFETWFVNELTRIRDYKNRQHKFSLWRQDRHEVDIVIESGSGIKLAIECKTGKNIDELHGVYAFKKAFPDVPVIIASMDDERPRKLESRGITVYPWKEALELYVAL